MKAATNTISMVRPRLSLPIMSGAVARRDRREAGDRDGVARMRRAHPVERLVELVDHRQQLARHRCRGCGRRPPRILLGGDEAPRQMLGSMSTYCLSVATSALPAFSASQRRSDSSDQTLPTPACFSTIACTSAMVASVSGVVERRALRELDQHVDRIGAGELGVEPARAPRPPAACRAPGRRGDSAAQVGVDEAETRHHDQTRSGCRAPDGSPCGRRSSRRSARRTVDADVGALLDLPRERASLRTSRTPSSGTSDQHRDQRDARSRAGRPRRRCGSGRSWRTAAR